ncbi:MAG: YdcF family protein [Candidatus Mariimomonas ferrooxydans]
MVEDIIKYVILPSNLIILLFLSGAILFLVKKARKFSSYLLIIAVVIYLFFASGPVSFWLLGNLEYQYPYLKDSESIKEVEYIVVLTAYAEADHLLPLSSRVNDSSAFRLIEAVRIFKKIPHSGIIISGSKDISGIMKELLIAMGINENKIIIENNSNNTFESAKNLQPLINHKPIVLVTSAGHMPRSMKVFKKLGMNPIPAPTNYFTRKNYLAINYLPSPLHLKYSDLAIQEYGALLYYSVMNQI